MLRTSEAGFRVVYSNPAPLKAIVLGSKEADAFSPKSMFDSEQSEVEYANEDSSEK